MCTYWFKLVKQVFNSFPKQNSLSVTIDLFKDDNPVIAFMMFQTFLVLLALKASSKRVLWAFVSFSVVMNSLSLFV